MVVVACTAVSCERQQDREPRAVVVSEDGEIKLRLMSFNIRYENPSDVEDRAWGRRVVGAVKMIREQKPDVIGVQEAVHGQAADLWASLPDYGFFGQGRGDGKRSGEYAGIFYDRTRFQEDPKEKGMYWLSDTPEKPGSRSWGNEIPRVVTWMRLEDRTTGRGFYVYNTHWDHRNQPSREKASLLMAARIDARKHLHEPVVVIGDFNSVEHNPAMGYLTGKQVNVAGQRERWKNGLTDVYLKLHPSDRMRRTLHMWRTEHPGPLKVDHILVSSGAKVAKAEILKEMESFISDHYAVTATISFPQD